MMDFSLKSSTNASLQGHTGYSWRGFPFKQKDVPVSFDPDPRKTRENAGHITPVAQPREQRTGQWVRNPFAAPEPNERTSGPFGGKITKPSGRFPHIWPGRGISGPKKKSDHFDDIEFGNDPRFARSDGNGSLHGSYDNSWYSPSPLPPYCSGNQSDDVSYLSLHSGGVSLQDPSGRAGSTDLPPILPERRNREGRSSSSTAKNALKEETGSDLLLTGNGRGGKCVRVIVAVSLVAVVALVVGVVLYATRPKAVVDLPPPTTPPWTTEPPPEIPVKLAFLKEPVLMNFAMADVKNVTQLDILRGDERLSTVNVTGNNTISVDPRMQVDIQTSNDSFRVILTLKKVTCRDEGIYVVVAKGDDREETKSVNLTVFRRPHAPVLETPDHIAESNTTDNPVCRVSSLGYLSLELTWIRRTPSGSETPFPASSHVDVISVDVDACQRVANSTLDAQGYTGWNNSDICCQLKEPKSSAVYFESCQRVLTVPEDYCSSGDDLRLYPYEPCYTYVRCQEGVVSFGSCPAQNGFCFNVTSQNCSAPPPEPPTKPPPEPLDPSSCTRQSASYVPGTDTYPDNCHKFQRCVGDKPVQDSCDSGLEFSYDENGDQDVVCSLPSNVTYCGKRFLQENVIVLPMANRTGRIGGNASLECVMTHITRLELVTFLHNDTEVASLNVSDSSVTPSRSNVDVTGQERGEGRERRFVAILTVSNPSCSDEGVYECVAEDGEHEARQTATLQLTRDPEVPTLEIPTDLVEFRTTRNPKCIASSLGYNPSMDFSWTLKRPDGREEKIDRSRHNDSNTPEACDTTGSSVLDARNYVTWSGSDLCCQLIDATNNNSVVKETCEKLLVLPPVEMDVEPVADIFMPYSLRCLGRNVSGDAQVEIYHEDQLWATFNTSALSGATNRSGLSVGGRLDNDMLRMSLNFTNIACSDGGSYKCIVQDSGIDTNATTTLAIRRPPSQPMLVVPDAAEGVTYQSPTCEVRSLGYNPIMTLTWVLKKPDGREEIKATFPADNNKVTKDDSTCNSSIDKTTLNAGRYTGWNNSYLCCQVTHPDTSVVVKEKCQLMLLVPKDYCPPSGTTNMVHPYDPCDKWVQCANGVEYVNNCGGTGLCYDIDKNACV